MMSLPRRTPRAIPRYQRGVSPQNIIIVLFGDYWFARPEPLPSSALVELLTIFEITEGSARAAIQRLARRKFLITHRLGRQTAYSVHAIGRESLEKYISRLFLAHLPREWDGTWTVLTYGSFGAPTPNIRLIQDGLKTLTFGRLNEALWIKPGRHSAELAQWFTELPTEAAEAITYFERANLNDSHAIEKVRLAFQVDQYDQRCREFHSYWSAEAEKIGGSWPEGHEAVRLRTRIMSEWRALIRDNPQLPAEMISGRSPVEDAAAICAHFYDGLGDSSAQVVRDVIREHDSTLASLVRHHTFRDADLLLEEIVATKDRA